MFDLGCAAEDLLRPENEKRAWLIARDGFGQRLVSDIMDGRNWILLRVEPCGCGWMLGTDACIVELVVSCRDLQGALSEVNMCK